MLDKTNAKVYLTIYGDYFPIETLSELLEIVPSKAYTKGEEVISEPDSEVSYKWKHYRKETSWEIGTEYEETYDLDEQINKLLKRIENKEGLIKDFCEKYDLKSHFMIVIKMNNGDTPGIVINHNFLRLANYLGAEIQFDLYANPYKSLFDS